MKSPIPFFYPFVILGFMSFTVIGTISHELNRMAGTCSIALVCMVQFPVIGQLGVVR